MKENKLNITKISYIDVQRPDEIYKDGSLLYEIEEFDDKEDCKIRYCR